MFCECSKCPYTDTDIVAVIMADSNSTGLGLPVLSTFTKEDFLKSAAAVQDHLRQQNPGLSESELDLKLSSGWWKPAVDFSAVLGVCASIL